MVVVVVCSDLRDCSSSSRSSILSWIFVGFLLNIWGSRNPSGTLFSLTSLVSRTGLGLLLLLRISGSNVMF